MEKLIITNSPDLEVLIISSVRKALEAIQSEKKGKETPFLNLREASKLLSLAPQTIYGMTCKREIPFFKRGKKLYFREADLVSWLEKGRKLTQEEIAVDSPGLTFNEKGGQND